MDTNEETKEFSMRQIQQRADMMMKMILALLLGSLMLMLVVMMAFVFGA